jgi:hypothetical protein
MGRTRKGGQEKRGVKSEGNQQGAIGGRREREKGRGEGGGQRRQYAAGREWTMRKGEGENRPG